MEKTQIPISATGCHMHASRKTWGIQSKVIRLEQGVWQVKVHLAPK